jgi:hypothetical protein
MKQLWNTHPTLTAVSLALTAALAAFAAGLVLDPRTIAGAPAWLKPAKFAASLAIYGLTLVWLFRYLPDWPRTRRAAGTITAVVALIEVAAVALQAWRGTTSHFNVGTAFDRTVFAVMGLAIVVQTVASVALVVALWRQRFDDRALGSALRFGMTIAVAGASLGGLMTQPTAAQIDQYRATGRLPIAGAHSVGGPDGGPGLPGVTWSTQHGDLRVPHFLGLHALQAMPLIALGLTVLRRRIGPDARLSLVRVAGVSYAGLTAILVWQALRGQSMVAPDVATMAAMGAWAAATVIAAAMPLRRNAIVPAMTALVGGAR